MATTIFQARLNILSVEAFNAFEWTVTGEVFDSSHSGFGPTNVQVGDVFFDESVQNGYSNRWRVTQVMSHGSPKISSIIVHCTYDEAREAAGLGQPVPSQGMIFRPTANFTLSHRGATGWTQVSETIKNAVRNSDMDRIDAALHSTPAGPQGDLGPLGPQGIQGPHGPQGFGLQGPQGDQGPSGGPQGTVGPQGPQGPSGGPQGPQGDVGVGVQGPQGQVGAGVQGPQGDVGSQGPNGLGGVQGPAGLQGSQGANGVGAQGERGPQGNSGSVGSQGPQGPAGTNGTTWYEDSGVPSGVIGINNDYYINIDNGDVYHKESNTWVLITNFTGEVGPQGTAGTQGANGNDGSVGPAGPQGDVGSAGTNGTTWYNGNGVPSGVIGINNDYYINIDNGDVYHKESNTWVLIDNFTGDFGPQGPQGQRGTQGEVGAASTVQGPQGAAGNQGSGGPQGNLGPQGPQGNDGIQGPQGGPADVMVFRGTIEVNGDFPATPANGDFYHVTDTVTDPYHTGQTFNAGDEIVWSSTTSEWVNVGNNMVGPQGPQGDAGTDGAQGPQGSGVQGPQGDVGPQGNQGDVGPQGSGVQGAAGSTWYNDAGTPDGGLGINGDYYINNNNGDVYHKEGGSWVLVTNLTGDIGSQGPQGQRGADGNVGPQGVAGSVGSAGPQGNNGSQGPQGAGVQGPQGSDGSQGPQGNNGNQGPVGPQGDVGAAGTNGNQGPQGAGVQGPQGPQGTGAGGGGDNPITTFVIELSNKTGGGSAQRSTIVAPSGWTIGPATTFSGLNNMSGTINDLIIRHDLNRVHADVKVLQKVDSDPFGANGYFEVRGDAAYTQARSEYNSGPGRAIMLSNFCNLSNKVVITVTLPMNY